MKITIHVIGDSHLLPLQNLKSDKYNIDLKTCIVQGATASGLKNPRSQTLSGPIFEKYLSSINNDDLVILHLGEVDCGFTMWLRAQRENISIEEQSKLTIENYRKLIESISNKTKKCAILNILPPTIKDGITIGDVSNLRREVKASQKERALLTKKMNFDLKKISDNFNFIFLEINKILNDPQTELIKDEFLNPNPEDHHLYPKKFLELMDYEINTVIKNLYKL